MILGSIGQFQFPETDNPRFTETFSDGFFSNPEQAQLYKLVSCNLIQYCCLNICTEPVLHLEQRLTEKLDINAAAAMAGKADGHIVRMGYGNIDAGRIEWEPVHV